MAFEWTDNRRRLAEPVAHGTATITVSSSGSTGSDTVNRNVVVTHIILDGPTMDNTGDQVRVNWKPQGSNASKSTMWYDTDNAAAWGVVVDDFDRWAVKYGDELEVEFSASQTADADVDVEGRGV